VNLAPLTQRFVLHFGEMGSRWGINRTVGQIYALLYVSPRALNADDIQFPVDASMLLKIIQQERIMACLDTNPRGTPDCAKEWWADVGGWMSHDYVAGDIAAATGPDHATAVMRAYVKLKMGNEVML